MTGMRIGYRKLSVAVAAIAVLALAGSSLAATGKPSITGFTPGSAKVGATVTISGKNLKGATAVKIDGRKASFTVKSATRISAKVPSGAKTGKISVTTKSGTATSSKKLTVKVTVKVVTSPPVSTTGGGLGSVTTNAASIQSNSTGNTIAFTYTAAAAITDGDVSIIVPNGWSMPITTSGAGCTTASVGQVTTGGYRINVSLSLAAGATTVITYGATTGGSCGAGDGAVSGPNVGTMTFEAEEQSSASGGIGFLSSSPTVTEVAQTFAPNGSGTLTSNAGTVTHATTGHTIAFTYTAATGGLYNGVLTIGIPAGWTVASTSNVAGCVAFTAGLASVATSGTGAAETETITVAGLILAAGQSVTITYGATSGDQCSAADTVTAPSTAVGVQTFAATEESTPSSDSFVALAASPTVTVS